MFKGSLPASAQSIIQEVIDSWHVDSLHIACSGNFTIERDLQERTLELHSCDVAIYTSALGCYFASQDFRLEVKDEHKDRLGFILGSLSTTLEKAATISLSTQMLVSYGRKNPYYERMFAAYVKNWPDLHRKTVEKFQKSAIRIKTYTAQDAVEWVAQLPPEAAIVSFPPFYKGDFEREFKKLDEVFDWDKPDYPEMDDGRRRAMFDSMMSKRFWAFGTHLPVEEFERFHLGMAKTTNRGVPIYIYGNLGTRRVVRPKQEIEPVTIPRLQAAGPMGERLHLAPLTTGQFMALRSKYMNIKIVPGMPAMAVGVLVDGHLAGCYAVSPPNSLANFPGFPAPYAYLLSDFPIEPTAFKRLAKLVLYAALSRESKLLCERALNRRVRALVTTAFTKKPVSMKYRGLFELLSRKELKGQGIEGSGDYYSSGYQLNYGAVMGEWNLQEGLAQWKSKHSESN